MATIGRETVSTTHSGMGGKRQLLDREQNQNPSTKPNAAARHTMITGSNAVHSTMGSSIRAEEGVVTWGRVRGGKLSPQSPLSGMGEGTGVVRKERGGGNLRGAPSLHSGLVITDSVREALLNPMSHRFKILRGSHHVL